MSKDTKPQNSSSQRRTNKPERSNRPSGSSDSTSTSNTDKSNKERIAKVMARAGVASRRECERMIEAGRVKVNGQLLKTPAFTVSASDDIWVDNNPLAEKDPARLWRYHKPTGLMTTHRDDKGRDTVFENLPEHLPRVISVGRLDMTSEGLMLLTNDGELARVLELPSTGWVRRYRARAFGEITQEALDTLRSGIMIDGKKTGSIEADFERQQGGNCWIAVSIREGKNREVRRALEELGLRVNRLIRISYGPFQLGNLERGQVEEVKNRILRDQVGHMIEIEKTRTPSANDKRTPEAKALKAAKSGKPARGDKSSSRKPQSATPQPNKPRTPKAAVTGKVTRKRRIKPGTYDSPDTGQNSHSDMPQNRGKILENPWDE